MGNMGESGSVRGFVFEALDIFALWSFSVSQPLLNLISQNGTFLVAHDCGPTETLLFVLSLCLILPACMVFAEGIFRLLNRHLYYVLHYVFMFSLVALFSLPLLKRIVQFPDVLVLSLAGAAALAFLFIHMRFLLIRKALRICSISVFLFPLVFLFTGQPRELIFSEGEGGQFHIDAAGKPPIVMVVFDEISGVYLQDEEGRLDSLRYPNFAALSSDSYWFPNALSVSDNTHHSLPAILTGQYYAKRGNRDTLPALVDYPHNLFTFLNGVYELNVVETSTKLSPEDDGIDNLIEERLPLCAALLVDTGVLYLNMVSPPGVGSRLPDVTQTWEGFLERANQKARRVDPEKIFGGRWADFFQNNLKTRDKTFRDFISSIKSSVKPVLNFLHIGLPHMPLEFYPSGKRYSGFKAERSEDTWPEDNWYVKEHFQGYMLQLGFADTLLGELIKGLKETEIYDKCLLVVLADHGVSYRPGDKRRTCTNTNFLDLMSIPLFMKLPNQTKGIVDNRYVKSIDVLPSIASAIGVEIPWRVDGISVFSPLYEEKPDFRLTSHGGTLEWVFKKEDVEKQLGELRLRTLSIFGSGTSKPNGLFAIGPHKELLGKVPYTDVPVKKGFFESKINEKSFFDDLDLAWNVLPLCISGRIMPSRAADNLPKVLAISLNNRIWTTTRLSDHGHFVAMLPEDALMQGKNSIEVFIVFSSEDDGVYLLGAKSSGQMVVGEYMIEEGAIFNTKEQKHYLIVPFALMSDLKKVRLYAKYTEFAGWAADYRNSKLVDRLIVFADGQSVYVTPTTIPRPNVADFYNDENLTMSGFRFLLPNDFVEKDIRLFAISKDLATETQYPEGSELDRVRFSPIVEDYCLEDKAIIHRDSKKKWSIEPYALKVYLNRVVKKDGYIELVGWAVDDQEMKLVDKIIVFAGRRSLYAEPTNVFREDIAKWYKNDAFLRSGFRFITHEEEMSDIRIFGIAGRKATEAYYPKDFGFLAE